MNWDFQNGSFHWLFAFNNINNNSNERIAYLFDRDNSLFFQQLLFTLENNFIVLLLFYFHLSHSLSERTPLWPLFEINLTAQHYNYYNYYQDYRLVCNCSNFIAQSIKIMDHFFRSFVPVYESSWTKYEIFI